MCVVVDWRYTTNRFLICTPCRSVEIAMTPNIDTGSEVAARTSTTERSFGEYLAEMTDVADVRRGIPSPQWRLAIDTSQGSPVPGQRAFVERNRPHVLVSRSSALLVAASVTTGGADPSIDYCAGTMGGDDPSTAYADAMLWYQGYPYSTPK
jgi:hypothetical protein